jgi:hypothetical protein
MTAYTSAGTTIALSASSPATFDSTGFAALTFTTVGEVTNIDGNIGRSYNLVTHQPLATRATVKKKGSYNSGSITLQLALDNDNAGQALLKTALSSDSNYSFKMTLQSGDIYYFQGMVMSFPITPASVDSITAGAITVEITADSSGNDFVLVNAA